MRSKYNFEKLEKDEIRIVKFSETDKHKLIFYIRSSWQQFRKYHNLDWKLSIKEKEFGVEIKRVS